MSDQLSVSHVVAGRDGTIWLRREERGGVTRWEVLDASGSVVARLDVPAALRILAADRTDVWGVETDDLDVPYVVRYRVEFAGGGRHS
jgi:NAD(P)H-nitrite reductase large subunit